MNKSYRLTSKRKCIFPPKEFEENKVNGLKIWNKTRILKATR